MFMEYINLQIAPDKVMILAYKYEYPSFIFENDIEINGWSIGKFVKIGGPPSKVCRTASRSSRQS